MQNKLIILFSIFILTVGININGQKLINTPYSRFNIGTLETQGSFKSLGMGGTGVALRDNNSIFFSNPASYSSLDTNSFVFDFGLDYGKNIMKGSTSKFKSDDLNFHHLILGFPVAKRFGVAVGIIPVSSGYYSISGSVTKNDPAYDPNVGAYAIDHSGNGAVTKFFIGTGGKITRDLSAGINLSFLSGTLTRTNQFIFEEYTTSFHNSSQEKLEIKGLNVDYGLQYTANLKNNYFLNIGASLTSGKNFNTKYHQLSVKYTAFSIQDTITYTSDDKAKTFIPAAVRLGIAFGKKNKFTTAVDYVSTNWSASKIPGSTGYAADTRNLMFGAEFIPDKFSNFSFINRIEYRIGAHVGDNYLIINGQQIKEYGGSVGLGIPIKHASTVANFSWGTINLYLDYTRRNGSSSSSLHYENYITAGFSLNLYDYWFIKRKYD
jgi:hypothetical protein